MHLPSDNSSFPYFPFADDIFKMTMGVQALNPPTLIEVDEAHYHTEIALKHQLLTGDHETYVQALAGTEREQWEVLALLLPNMAHRYPHHFSLHTDGECWTWQNHLLDTVTMFRLGDTPGLPLAPLDWLGRQVQEDLLLLSDDADQGMPLIAGHLCFPNDWCLQDKIGLSFLDVHGPVPLFAQHLGRSSLLLLERLKVGRPVWRVNWAFKATSQLPLLPGNAQFLYEEANKKLTRETIGDSCFLRVERQALARLPQTNAILFTVHTYQTPLAEIVQNVEYARCIANVVRTTPTELLTYKGMMPFVDVLLNYVETHS
jgi:hypothetical protein